ncbi:23S rRNA pseudouridine1911/1915/1917 synthase [Paenibacillus castaneae]|uniref:RluA family pseudouridine synthase n=1 Tax=Paenibacillus castaneae TaxID=474957 RepID=UPI001FBAEC3F|nr:RluA family pseudouridine synthase [Paenibacillus castaneae]NIK75979.1 23S rRNA pseudouridine1911/1915/1917 synthase [Paenibacillus castaneae]
MMNGQIKRNGQWLELKWSSLGAESDKEAIDPHTERASADVPELAQPRAGSHPHLVRQWLLARSLFPQKWINRLFSIGGIQLSGDTLQLLAFPSVDPQRDPLYRKALMPSTLEAPLILYEDDFCVVFFKPAGMAVHESSPHHMGTLDEAAARHQLLKGDPLTIRHIHRLDDDTSGPVLYAKNDLAQWKLDEAMRLKEIDRHYIAVVHGRISKPSGTINLPIGKDRHHRSRRRVADNGEQAVTHYERIEAGRAFSLLRVKLETGRTHQIRVHMSHIGHPLVGDALYGGDARLLPHQALHGEKLLFPHPWTSSLIEAAAPWPDWLNQLAHKLQTRSN